MKFKLKIILKVIILSPLLLTSILIIVIKDLGLGSGVDNMIDKSNEKLNNLFNI